MALYKLIRLLVTAHHHIWFYAPQQFFMVSFIKKTKGRKIVQALLDPKRVMESFFSQQSSHTFEEHSDQEVPECGLTARRSVLTAPDVEIFSPLCHAHHIAFDFSVSTSSTEITNHVDTVISSSIPKVSSDQATSLPHDNLNRETSRNSN